MVYYLLPLIIFIICLIGIIFIIVRRFPNLATLDVKSIPQEQHSRVKADILAQRFDRKLKKINQRIIPLLYPIKLWFNKLMTRLHEWAVAREQDYKKTKWQEENGGGFNKEQKIKELMLQVNELVKTGQWNEAEKKIIEVISLTPKNIEAFMELGDLYVQQKENKQAQETFRHILKIDSRFSEAYCRLGVIMVSEESFERAIKYFQQALDLEPNNPRYLDLLLETSIIGKKKGLAQMTFNKLKEVNPDNQKLKEFADKIKKLK